MQLPATRDREPAATAPQFQRIQRQAKKRGKKHEGAVEEERNGNASSIDYLLCLKTFAARAYL